jgi:exodeoxyribonuclease-5
VAGEPLAVTRNSYGWRAPNQLDFLANGEIVTTQSIGPGQTLGQFHFRDVIISAPGCTEESVLLEGKLLVNPLQPPFPQLAHRDQAKLFRLVYGRYAALDERARRSATYQDPCYNALTTRYAYAVTVHRAQGSQYQDVYLDLRDWNWYRRKYPVTAVRWLYTAVTRAKRRLYLIGLPGNRLETLLDFTGIGHAQVHREENLI